MGYKNNRKQALIDSSSMILLFKSGLLRKIIEYYNIIMTESVFAELTQNDHTGSKEIRQFVEERQIHILSKTSIQDTVEMGNVSVMHLVRGEQDSIIAYLHGIGDFIILDDGKGAGYCKKHEIPYINALLIPRILQIANSISNAEFKKTTQTIIGCGRYSEKIIEFARTCPDEKLDFFV